MSEKGCKHECDPCPYCRVLELEADLRAALTGWDKSNDRVKAFRAEIQDCRDGWAPDQPPSDLSQFLIDLESTLDLGDSQKNPPTSEGFLNEP